MIEPEPGAFRHLIETYTKPATPSLIPEIQLYLASEVNPIWHATEQELATLGIPPPFWAFCWPGGAALARYILDRPELVRGKHVLDFACGGGCVAIAAAWVGGEVTGCDIDPLAIAALDLNCSINGVPVTGMHADPTAATLGDVALDRDIILAGDIFYEQTMADRTFHWLKARAATGAIVLIGDPGRAYLPSESLQAIASMDVPTSRELEESDVRRTTIWRLEP